MIIEKRPLPDDPTPSDAPPSYETLGGNTSYSSAKSGLFDHPPPSPHSPSSSSLRSPSIAPLKSPSTPTSPTNNKGKVKATNWFNFTASRTSREVRSTVLGLVRDLVQEHICNFSAASGILQSCADACAAQSVSLSSILQERSIENHTPLYWAIVKRLPDEHQDVEASQGPDLMSALLSYSTPLLPETVAEIRIACLATSDQRLFQRLRLSPEFAPISGSDQMLLGGTIPPDEVDVEDLPGDGGAFVVNFEIPHFHKRMVVSKEIVLEFIARSRMWRLAFVIIPESNGHRNGLSPGSWCITLGLLETSPPTCIDSRLLIAEAATSLPKASDLLDDSTPPPTTRQSPFRRPSNTPKPKPTISLRLQSSEQLEAPRRGQAGRQIVVSLQDSLMGANLQYGNNPYVGPDEKLRARLEARLGKPETECIIC
ncbi:hypothetical protein B0H34DRAFT_796403 [Crassisporium funariophilum]|nr:hypothetical protein B0H34DRAFT_796403 [Crassisporium funariophilum]